MSRGCGRHVRGRYSGEFSAISRTTNLSPRKTSALKRDKKRGKNMGIKSSQIQIRSSSVKPAGGKLWCTMHYFGILDQYKPKMPLGEKLI